MRRREFLRATALIAATSAVGAPVHRALADSAASDLAPILIEVRKRFPDVTQVGIKQAQTLKPAIVLDVREREEFAVSHLEGARLAPNIDDALAALDDKPKDALILTYCSVGWRSSELAAALAENGYTNVVNLEGSIFAWANLGMPVFRDGARVWDVHPFSWRWGRYLEPQLRTRVPR